MKFLFITFRLPEMLKKKAENRAKKEGVSMSHWLRTAIYEKLDKK